MTLGAKIPGWLDKIQFITFYAMNPCEVPFMLYVETARPITLEIALVFLTIDTRQFLRAVFRPKWMRSHRHTRRGPRKGRRLPGVPEPAELIADILDPDHHLRPTRWKLGFRLVLEWFDIQDRIFWTIFLVEMADTLIINTLVGVLEADPSLCPDISRALLSSATGITGGVGPELMPTGYDTVDYAVGVDILSGFSQYLPKGKFLLVMTGFVRCTYPTAEFTPMARFSQGADTSDEYGPELKLIEGEVQPYMVSRTVEGPGAVSWHIKRTDGFFVMNAIRGFILQIGN